MNGFRYKIYQFMQGRRGLDNLSRFLMYTAMIMLFISVFIYKIPIAYRIVYYSGVLLFVYSYFRVLSRNLYKREIENNKYLALKYKITKGKSLRQRRYERSLYTYFKCPSCKQKMRAPKGKGNVKVKCHNCGNEFVRKV